MSSQQYWIYQDYQFWHNAAKQSQASGNCESAAIQRMMAMGDWIASGHTPDQGHYTIIENLQKCAAKRR
jgi:hypothetical protein